MTGQGMTEEPGTARSAGPADAGIRGPFGAEHAGRLAALAPGPAAHLWDAIHADAGRQERPQA